MLTFIARRAPKLSQMSASAVPTYADVVAAEKRSADLREMVAMERRAQAAELRAEKAEVEAKL